ncbi:MAG: holo-ACP synthase [Rickettsiaceae bacterium]|nr:MAG: holo-ACP synthase [Rickettsiaceae bacterium]
MIIGIGTDIVQITRIERIFGIYGNLFQKKILTDKELVKFNCLCLRKKVSFLSNRFAAKEAVCKAFGTGICNKLTFKDISILNDKYGKPYVEIDTKIIKIVTNYDNVVINLSISDDYPTAIAFSVISVQ